VHQQQIPQLNGIVRRRVIIAVIKSCVASEIMAVENAPTRAGARPAKRAENRRGRHSELGCKPTRFASQVVDGRWCRRDPRGGIRQHMPRFINVNKRRKRINIVKTAEHVWQRRNLHAPL
jgi:hypothetical protein